jgi:hypothetical protein
MTLVPLPPRLPDTRQLCRASLYPIDVASSARPSQKLRVTDGSDDDQKIALRTLPGEVEAGFNLAGKLADRVNKLESSAFDEAQKLEKQKKEGYKRYTNKITVYVRPWVFGCRLWPSPGG